MIPICTPPQAVRPTGFLPAKAPVPRWTPHPTDTRILTNLCEKELHDAGHSNHVVRIAYYIGDAWWVCGPSGTPGGSARAGRCGGAGHDAVVERDRRAGDPDRRRRGRHDWSGRVRHLVGTSRRGRTGRVGWDGDRRRLAARRPTVVRGQVAGG